MYAIDDEIDDETFCEKVKRGLFRLHPNGPLGRSEGCVVINKESDFLLLRTILKNTSKRFISGTELESYGRLVVT
ncbi:MAG: tlde1 domain-containing protein [Pseudomonadota bacterium]